MGKGYNNYMCKKPFHPGSKANIKRTWMAEQRTENEKQKQEELRVQYEKEQELYNNRALLSKESKDKLALNFMYEAPPGAKKERQKEDNEPEYKFEWQRKYNAPREDFAKNNKEIRDQPFGIPVRNVRCIKCHQWGHLNTDKECPLYHQAGSSSSLASTSVDPLELMRQMREEGLALKQSILGHHLDASKNNQHFVASDNEEEDPEMAFLKGLSLKQKKKLLRKLNKLAEGKERAKKKKQKKKKKGKKSKRGRDDSSGTDSEEGRSGGKERHRKRSASTTSSSDSESSSSNGRGRSRHREAKRKRDSSSSSSSPERRRHKQHRRKHQ